MSLPQASDAELEIRLAVVARLRTLLPGARIIHELNVEGGTVRTDIAAVSENLLYLVEVKSARDKLHRLSAQIRHFHTVCHGLIVAADEKWCGAAADYPNCDARKIIAHHGAGQLWQWPEPAERWHQHGWQLPRPTPPWPFRMLRLLWADELRAVARSKGVSTNPRSPAYKLVPLLAAKLSGEEVTAAVCQALRERQFAWADPVQEVAA